LTPQTVILAGGLGTRLRPLTNSRPKSMVEVMGKPFLQHQIELLRAHGLTRFILCVGHEAEQIVSHFGDGVSLGVEIKYSHDGASPLGTGGALVKAIPLLDPWFMVLDGDSYLPIDFHACIAHFRNQDPLALMMVYRNANRYGRSNVAIKRGWVTVYDRTQGDFVYIHSGLTIFHRQALETAVSDRSMQMDEIYQRLVANRNLACFILRQRFYEIGSHTGLADVERYLVSSRSRTIKPHPIKSSTATP
jgi:NDP-sugar pyrophosphorylase family protein